MNTSTITPNETNLRRVQNLSSVLRRICTVLLAGMSIITAVGVVTLLAGRISSVTLPGNTIPFSQLNIGGKVLVGLFGLLASAFIIKGLYHLRRLLDNYSRREIFTADSARQIRQFGFTCALWGALKIFGGFLPAILAVSTGGPTHIEADTLLIGLVIVVISRFAEMATALREENDLTI